MTTPTSYLILHERPGCGAAPSSFHVIRCWYADDNQVELFVGSWNDARAYLAAHWDDPDPREHAATLPAIPHASDVEKAIVGRLITDLLAAGMKITIWNGGDTSEIEDCTDAAKIFAELSASDQDELTMDDADGYAGWIRLVWGNDHCVISDYSTRLEPQMRRANKLADDLEDGKAKPDGIGKTFAPNTTARFWIYINSGITVLLKLRKGQSVSYVEGGQDDEGYQYIARTWSFDGEEVTVASVRNARDCDGLITSERSSYCPLADLKAGYHCPDHEPHIVFPKWRERSFEQRDHSAEAAGY